MSYFLQIKDGDIFAAINQKDGMVSFQEDPEQYNTCEMTQRLNNEIHQYVSLPCLMFKGLLMLVWIMYSIWLEIIRTCSTFILNLRSSTVYVFTDLIHYSIFQLG